MLNHYIDDDLLFWINKTPGWNLLVSYKDYILFNSTFSLNKSMASTIFVDSSIIAIKTIQNMNSAKHINKKIDSYVPNSVINISQKHSPWMVFVVLE